MDDCKKISVNFGKMLQTALQTPRKMSQRLEMCLVNVVFR
jgi:hypothetical protein